MTIRSSATMSNTRKKYRPRFEPVPEGIDYFDLPQVSNSDLSSLHYETSKIERIGNIEKAYEFGTLVDAVITEHDRINVIKRQIDGKPINAIDFERVTRMREAFFRDEEARTLLKYSDCQKVMIRNVPLAYRGVSFVLPMRCKWDMWIDHMWFGGDLKSTMATSQQQFEAACQHFDYDRQRAFYMTIAGSDQDFLIGVSKINFKVFKMYIKRGDRFFNSGMSKMLRLAFKYHMMYA